MPVILRITDLEVTFGGHENSGWLPPGSSQPEPTPQLTRLVNLEICEEGGSFHFVQPSSSGTFTTDTWHRTLDEALERARVLFGVTPEDWEEA